MKVTYWKATDGFYAVMVDGDTVGHVHRDPGHGRPWWVTHDEDCREVGAGPTRAYLRPGSPASVSA